MPIKKVFPNLKLEVQLHDRQELINTHSVSAACSMSGPFYIVPVSEAWGVAVKACLDRTQ